MVEPCRHLSEHRQFCRLNQLLLGFPKFVLGTFTFPNFFHQLAVGVLQVCGPLGHAALQLLPSQGKFSFAPVAFAQIKPGQKTTKKQRGTTNQKSKTGPDHRARAHHYLKIPVQFRQRRSNAEILSDLAVFKNIDGSGILRQAPGLTQVIEFDRVQVAVRITLTGSRVRGHPRI